MYLSLVLFVSRLVLERKLDCALTSRLDGITTVQNYRWQRESAIQTESTDLPTDVRNGRVWQDGVERSATTGIVAWPPPSPSPSPHKIDTRENARCTPDGVRKHGRHTRSIQPLQRPWQERRVPGSDALSVFMNMIMG